MGFAIQLDDDRRHQANDLALPRQEGRFIVPHFAPGLQALDNFPAVFGVFPDVDLQRGLPDHLFPLVAGNLLEAFIHGNEHAVFCPGDGN